MIQCVLDDGTVKGTYIGCGNHTKEYKAKQFHPPPRMAADIATYKPYATYFRLTLLDTCATKAHIMHAVEAHHIRNFNNGAGTRGAGGYNTLKGTPSSCRQYLYLKYHGLLRSQRRMRPTAAA
jgi:hypothetical protein